MKDAGDPYELLRKDARKGNVCPAKNERDNQDECKQDYCVRVETKAVAVVVDTTTSKVRVVTVQCDARYCGETEEDDEKLSLLVD